MYSLVLDNILFKNANYYSRKFIHNTILDYDYLLDCYTKVKYWLSKINLDQSTHIIRLSTVISTLH